MAAVAGESRAGAALLGAGSGAALSLPVSGSLRLSGSLAGPTLTDSPAPGARASYSRRARGGPERRRPLRMPGELVCVYVCTRARGLE